MSSGRILSISLQPSAFFHQLGVFLIIHLPPKLGD